MSQNNTRAGLHDSFRHQFKTRNGQNIRLVSMAEVTSQFILASYTLRYLILFPYLYIYSGSCQFPSCVPVAVPNHGAYPVPDLTLLFSTLNLFMKLSARSCYASSLPVRIQLL
jgi:hypothetical protein